MLYCKNHRVHRNMNIQVKDWHHLDVRTFQGLASSTKCNWPTVSSVLEFDDWILSEAPYGQPIQERKLVIFYTSLFFSTNTQKIAFIKTVCVSAYLPFSIEPCTVKPNNENCPQAWLFTCWCYRGWISDTLPHSLMSSTLLPTNVPQISAGLLKKNQAVSLDCY